MKKIPYYHFGGNIIIRILVGGVFLSEGIQKFLFPIADGAGRFAKLGVPYPSFLGPFVGATEIIFGIMLLAGLLTRLATIPLLIVILVAIYTSKIIPFMAKGFWVTMHEGRADFSMLMGLIFLSIYGAGKYSLDGKLFNTNK